MKSCYGQRFKMWVDKIECGSRSKKHGAFFRNRLHDDISRKRFPNLKVVFIKLDIQFYDAKICN